MLMPCKVTLVDQAGRRVVAVELWSPELVPVAGQVLRGPGYSFLVHRRVFRCTVDSIAVDLHGELAGEVRTPVAAGRPPAGCGLGRPAEAPPARVGRSDPDGSGIGA